MSRDAYNPSLHFRDGQAAAGIAQEVCMNGGKSLTGPTHGQRHEPLRACTTGALPAMSFRRTCLRIASAARVRGGASPIVGELTADNTRVN
jgi:hypothetical protein